MTVEIVRVVEQMRHSENGDRLNFSLELILDELITIAPDIGGSMHPLGFIHMELTPLVPVCAAERVRLHIWPSEGYGGDPAGNVHDHTWDLTSVVLLGELRDRNYVPRKALDGIFHGSRVGYGSVNSFEREGRYHLDLVSDRCVRRGSVYKIPSRVVHESDVISAPTITLVLSREEDASFSPGPLLFSRQDAPVGTPTRQLLAEGVLVGELIGLREQISA